MVTIETSASKTQTFDVERQRRIALKAIEGKSYATLATSSQEHRPHVAGILYAAVDGVLYISTGASSIKARNVRQNPQVAVCIPVRKLPVGPPFAVQFQGTAEILSQDDPNIRSLHDTGRLKRVTSHGELELPGGCFIRVTPGKRMSTYGLGVPLLDVIRNPLTAVRSMDWS